MAKSTRTSSGDDSSKNSSASRYEDADEQGHPDTGGSVDQSTAPFPIVGVGASAGGIEAFTQLLQALPPDTGMAYVYIQHLHPDYESALTEILARETAIPVQEAQHDMAVQPDHVYVIPPDAYLGISGGVLQLLPRPRTHERRRPVDQFFRSLAADHHNRAIGVVLSGTASDGVLGLKAIKAEGGITFAQDEASAKYDGMPHSAFASGAVDFVLPPSGIAAELASIAHHPYIVQERAGKAPDLIPDKGESLDRLFTLMRRHSGHDFTYYKHTTIQRRIRRRMLLHKLDRLENYVRYVQDHPAELDELFQDILINVTSFFRDPEVFDVLREKVFPSIVPDPPPAHAVRIWVPGCSTGEEAYSVAIAFLEFLGEHATTTPVQVFATDIDDAAIARARAGIYPENIAQDVSPERLRRYFVQVEGGYQVCKLIRDLCVFAVQDVARDPPFSRLDFISCRNLLIYLGPVLQKRIMRVFHYALKPQGFLLLGTAENIGEHGELFRGVDAKEKIYAKKSTVSPVHLELDTTPEAPPPLPSPDPGWRPTRRRQPFTGPVDVQREADRVLMNSYIPAAVVINQNMEILLFRGRSGAYLEPAPGEASLNLLKMARDDLMVGLNAAVRESMATHATTSRRGINLAIGGTNRRVDIEVTPLAAPAVGDGEGRFYLVVFRELSPLVVSEADEAPAGQEPGDEQAQARRHLEQELAATKEYLQSVIEQKETNNEELRSANEEIQSSNEELQSINEELETAKEELQSTNEELATVNDELESRNIELARANNDLTNLIASMDIPIVIVSIDLRIRRFTPQSQKLLNLISSDVGRPISDIKPNIEVPGFTKMLTAAIDHVQTSEQDARDGSGRWYSVRVRPYRTQDNKIDGAVIAFVDINDLKRALDEAQAARDYGEAIIAAVRHPLLVLDKDLRVVSASAAYLETFQVNSEDTLDNLVYRLGNGQWAIPDLRKRLNEIVKADNEFQDFLVVHEFQHIGTRSFRISGRRIHANQSNGPMVLMQIEAEHGFEDTAAGESS